MNVETQPLRLTQAKRPMIAFFDFETDRTRQFRMDCSRAREAFLFYYAKQDNFVYDPSKIELNYV